MPQQKFCRVAVPEVSVLCCLACVNVDSVGRPGDIRIHICLPVLLLSMRLQARKAAGIGARSQVEILAAEQDMFVSRTTGRDDGWCGCVCIAAHAAPSPRDSERMGL